ncbi:MAG TPA: aspartate-semialdehyde dehydrogenase [Bdellovibrionota bacterium]|nr:aspartate-semialdehyde dehydrogenase [Bdellovibrionota bacterium]
MKSLRIAVVGATGAVGREMFSVLQSRKFPVAELVPFASARSEGKALMFNDKSRLCKVMKPGCFEGIDIAFFDASDPVSKEWVPRATEEGAWAIDNSAAFRMESDVPLVVPEVNGHLVEERAKRGLKSLTPRERIIAGPNCTTVQLVVALKPLADRYGMKRLVISTYQSTSGAGTAAMDELSTQTVGMFNSKKIEPKAFTHQIAFNCIPQIGGFKDDGYTSEEHKLMAETRKILGLPDLAVSATAIRVPTFSCHGESVNIEFRKPVTAEEARALLSKSPGVIVQDEPEKSIYPMGFVHAGDVVEGATGKDAVYVGRIRRDPSVEHGLNLWVVSDNLRKGAALNAVQVGEIILRNS